jgi:hypothetical protein
VDGGVNVGFVAAYVKNIIRIKKIEFDKYRCLTIRKTLKNFFEKNE